MLKYLSYSQPANEYMRLTPEKILSDQAAIENRIEGLCTMYRSTKHGFYYHNNYSSVNICCRIQRIWRGFLARKFVKQKREEELTFIGMVSMAHQSIYSETHKHEE